MNETSPGRSTLRALPARTRAAVITRPWTSAAAGAVVVAAATGVYLLTAGSGSAADTTARTVTTRLVAASTGTVRASVSTTGTVTAADTTDVSFPAAAEVTSVRVAQGDKVTKGEVLGTIDTLSLRAALAQARATLAEARSTLATAQDSSDTGTAQLTADEATVATAKSAVTDAEDALAGATLRAPISGTVAEVNVAKGDTSAGGSSSGGTAGSTGGGTTAQGGTGTSTTADTSSSSTADFVVVGMRKWTVSASVDDTQVGLVHKGDQVQIATDNVTGTVFGTVASVSVLSSSTSGTAGYPVSITVTGSPDGLHDGASATAAIVYKQVTNVVTVPTTAVHSAGTGSGSGSYVYVAKNGIRTKQTVTTGLASGGTTQIRSGLTNGTQVYVETVSAGGGTRGTTGGQQGGAGEGGTGEQGGMPAGGFPGGGNFPGAGQQGGSR